MAVSEGGPHRSSLSVLQRHFAPSQHRGFRQLPEFSLEKSPPHSIDARALIETTSQELPRALQHDGYSQAFLNIALSENSLRLLHHTYWYVYCATTQSNSEESQIGLLRLMSQEYVRLLPEVRGDRHKFLADYCPVICVAILRALRCPVEENGAELAMSSPFVRCVVTHVTALLGGRLPTSHLDAILAHDEKLDGSLLRQMDTSDKDRLEDLVLPNMPLAAFHLPPLIEYKSLRASGRNANNLELVRDAVLKRESISDPNLVTTSIFGESDLGTFTFGVPMNVGAPARPRDAPRITTIDLKRCSPLVALFTRFSDPWRAETLRTSKQVSSPHKLSPLVNYDTNPARQSLATSSTKIGGSRTFRPTKRRDMRPEFREFQDEQFRTICEQRRQRSLYRDECRILCERAIDTLEMDATELRERVVEFARMRLYDFQSIRAPVVTQPMRKLHWKEKIDAIQAGKDIFVRASRVGGAQGKRTSSKELEFRLRTHRATGEIDRILSPPTQER